MAQEAEIPGAVVGGTYRLVRPLAGDSGRVYEARHDRLTGRFVVKLLADAEPDAFQRNAQLVSALRHPGVVQVIDYSASEGQAFVVMEYIDGRPLSELIAEAGIMPADRVARVVDNVAAGLAAAHELGLAHGHLSPQRIFVQRAGSRSEKTKVVGLGLGDEISGLPELTELTPYTAPEQVGEEAEPRSDQFALAAIAYEMLTGVPPFDDSTERQEPPSIRDYAPDVNVIVDDVIRRALAPEPDDRWPDISMFAQRLREAGDSTSLEEKTRVTGIPLRPAHVSTTLTPTPVDGMEGFELPVLETPLPDPALVTPVDVDLGTPVPRSAVGTLVTRNTASRPTHLPPPGGSSGFVLPPPSQSALPVLRHPPHPRSDTPWTMSAAPELSLSGHGGAVMATTARRSGRRKSTGGVVVLIATAALIAFVVVKTDLLGHGNAVTGAAAEVTAGAPPATTPADQAAPPPGAAPAMPAPAEAQIATQAASATAEPAPAPPADEAAPEAIENAAAQPQVVQLPANAGLDLGDMPAAEQPVKRHTAHHRPKAAALPPELAAEEALLSGGPPISRRGADKAHGKRAAAAKRPSASDADPWAE